MGQIFHLNLEYWFNFADSGFPSFFGHNFFVQINSVAVLPFQLIVNYVLSFFLFIFLFFLSYRFIYLAFYFSFCADGDGRLTGNDATKIFAMSNLSRPELKQVYSVMCLDGELLYAHSR